MDSLDFCAYSSVQNVRMSDLTPAQCANVRPDTSVLLATNHVSVNTVCIYSSLNVKRERPSPKNHPLRLRLLLRFRGDAGRSRLAWCAARGWRPGRPARRGRHLQL